MSYRPGESINRFTIERRLSITRMSEVYLVYDSEKYERLNKRKYYAVAKISVTDGSHADENNATIKREISTLRKLIHPSIVRIYPLEEYKEVMTYERFKDNRSFFVMEYINGGSLQDRIGLIQNYDLSWKIELFVQIISALNYIHQCGYAHLDLKPQNILLREEPHPNRLPLPVLIDFGNVQFLDRHDEDIAATRRYAPPEVLAAIDRPDVPHLKEKIIPAKADIWALGAIFFEILMGRPMIKGHTDEEITDNVVNGNFDVLPSHLPKELERVKKLLTIEDPATRPGASELLEVFNDIILSFQPPRISISQGYN